jgi:glutamyl-tRNA reductase
VQYILAGLSIDHAPVELLEQVSVQPHELRVRLEELNRHAGGGIILSTCNRTEIVGASADPETGLGRMTDYLELLASRNGPKRHDISKYVYRSIGDDVIRHTFRVTAGLDSLAIGEAQVAGQVSRALQAAGETGEVEPLVSRMFHAALRNSRVIRKETGLGKDSLSVSSIGLHLVQREAGNLSDKTVLVVGAGETGRLTARTLKHVGVKKMLVTSRSVDRARLLGNELDGEAVPFSEMTHAIKQADVVVACTASMTPVITQAQVAQAMSERPDRRLIVLDVGMPRDVDPQANNLPNVKIFSLERLHEISEEHRSNRLGAAAEADLMIERAVERFKEQLAGAQAEPVIRTLGSRFEGMRQVELERAMAQMPELAPEYVRTVDAMSKALVKRMLADPITFLRSGISESAIHDVALLFDLGYDEFE